MTGLGFFNSQALIPNKGKSPAFVFVGGTIFHAVSVALIDHLKSGRRLASPSLNKIQAAFSRYFPDYKLHLIHLTPNSPCKSELVERMAYVLRQLALDEVLDKATQYRELFKGLSPNTPQSHLRTPSTPLHFSVLGALAQVFDIGFELSLIEEKNDLRQMIKISAPLGAAFEISLEVQGNGYSPKVAHPHDFKYVGHIALNPVPCEKESSTQTLRAALDAIEHDNCILFERYGHYVTILSNMVRDADLTREQLIQCYIDSIPTEHSTHGMDRAVFFSDKTQALADDAMECSADHDTRLIIHHLAGWMATGQLDSGHFFDRLDVPKHSNPTAMSL